MDNENLVEFCKLISDIIHGLFDSEEDQCDVNYVHGDRDVTFVVKPTSREAAALIIGKKGRIIHRIESVVAVYGEIRGGLWRVVVEQPDF